MTQNVNPSVSTPKDILWTFVFVVASVIGCFKSTNFQGQLLSYTIFFFAASSFLFHLHGYITKRGVVVEVKQDASSGEQATPEINAP